MHCEIQNSRIKPNEWIYKPNVLHNLYELGNQYINKKRVSFIYFFLFQDNYKYDSEYNLTHL